MNSFLVAALLTGMTASGGAGAAVEANAQPREPGRTWEDVRKDFDALRSEVSTLEVAYNQALERRRAEAKQHQEALEHERRGR